ncbi:hypothetical protein F5X68DRAFT_240857 [Plectosphaerella plurivora]|uniref:Uncharacterized protein n=1 Tax=Plectosphaerella plurivora TaxID=936078 RepID=A0A9P8V9A8_9PEZI|nr:hypothetical protein F5X68DRAFT_240857 [Plectosphaerella plurivora]
MVDEICLARAIGFGSIQEVIGSKWDDLFLRLQVAFHKKAITETETIFVATEWLIENVPYLGVTTSKKKSPIITSWCMFLANLGCKKCDVVTEYEDAVRDRSKVRGRLPCYGYSIGLVQVEYDRKRAETARSSRINMVGSVSTARGSRWTQPSSAPAPTFPRAELNSRNLRKNQAAMGGDNGWYQYQPGRNQRPGGRAYSIAANASQSPEQKGRQRGRSQRSGSRPSSIAPNPSLSPELSDNYSGMSKRQILLGGLSTTERQAYLKDKPNPQPGHPRAAWTGSNSMPLGAPNKLKRGTDTRPQSDSPTRQQSSASRGPAPKRPNLGTQGCGTPSKGRLTPPEFTPKALDANIKQESSPDPRPGSQADADAFLKSLAGQLGAGRATATSSGASMATNGENQASPMGMNSLRTALPVLGSPRARLTVPAAPHSAKVGGLREADRGARMSSGALLNRPEFVKRNEILAYIKEEPEPEEPHPAIERLFQNRPKGFVQIPKRNTVTGLLRNEAMTTLKESLMQRVAPMTAGSRANVTQDLELPDAPVSETVEE